MNNIKILSMEKPEDHPIKSEFSTASTHQQEVFLSLLSELSNARRGGACSKTKGEVSGTGKKPHKQKHTGKARQGSRRNPHFVGGGVCFGPRPGRNFCLKQNKSQYKCAAKCVLSYLMEQKKINILDLFSSDQTPKTNLAARFLVNNSLIEKKILIVCGKLSATELSFRNLPQMITKTVDRCSLRDVLNCQMVLVEKNLFDGFLDKFSPST